MAPPHPPAIFGTHDEKTLAQLRDVARAERAALMADGHVGHVMPIGGVAAYCDKVSVVGVGFDILPAATLPFAPIAASRSTAVRISAGLRTRSNGRSASAWVAPARLTTPVDHPLFEDPAWEAIPGKHERDTLRAKARAQLGTVGSGNHYVDVFVDETGAIWVGVHFGSRGFGHTIASGFLALSRGRTWKERVPEGEVLLDLKTPMGEAYWSLTNWPASMPTQGGSG